MTKTPFELAGYTKDTKFKFVGLDEEYEQGEILWLHTDDGTNTPKFTNGVEHKCLWMNYDVQALPPIEYKVGDKIIITDNKSGHNFEIGEVVTIVEDCSDERLPNWRCSNKEDLSRVECGWVYVGDFELATIKETPINYPKPIESLVSIVKDTKYNVTIKGVAFTFTQAEFNGLVSGLEGYKDYE